jgi:hypothetical protein
MSNIIVIAFKLFLLIFGLASVIGGLLLLWGVYRTRSRIKASQTWPETTGTVTSAEIFTQHHRRGDTYIPDVKYSYSVLGSDFTGKIILDDQSTNDEALALIAPFQVGSALAVRYNPENPQEHVTKQDEITTRLYLVALVILALGALMIFSSFRIN